MFFIRSLSVSFVIVTVIVNCHLPQSFVIVKYLKAGFVPTLGLLITGFAPTSGLLITGFAPTSGLLITGFVPTLRLLRLRF